MAALTRRGLLGLLAGAAMDPELLLWRPGAKTIFIPKPRLQTLMAAFEVPGGRWNRDMYDAYLLPAAAALADEIDRQVVHSMRLQMPSEPLISGMAFAAPVPLGNRRYGRAFVAWDAFRGKYVGRVDATFYGLERSR